MRDASGKIVGRDDYNRSGLQKHAQIFAPLFSENANALQKCVRKMIEGWSGSKLQEIISDIKALPHGEVFLAKVEGKSTKCQSLNCERHMKSFNELSEDQRSAMTDKQKKIHSKLTGFKMQLFYWISSNKCMEMTWSDLSSGTLLADPEGLINPNCLTKGQVKLRDQAGRMNTVFEEAVKGNAFALKGIESPEGDQTGIFVEKQQRVFHDLFASLGHKAH